MSHRYCNYYTLLVPSNNYHLQFSTCQATTYACTIAAIKYMPKGPMVSIFLVDPHQQNKTKQNKEVDLYILILCMRQLRIIEINNLSIDTAPIT